MTEHQFTREFTDLNRSLLSEKNALDHVRVSILRARTQPIIMKAQTLGACVAGK